MFRVLILIILMLVFPVIQAQIYTWVDEDGVTHFGDKVPEQYQQKSDNVEVDTSQPTEAEVKEAQDRVRRMNDYQPQKTHKKPASKRVDKKNNYSSDYERKMAEYRESQACFARCQSHTQLPGRVVRLPDGTTYQESGRTVTNNAASGHFKSVTEPTKN